MRESESETTQTVISNDIFEHPTRLNAVVSDDSGDILEYYRYSAFGEVTIYDDSGNIQQESQIDNDILWNTRRPDEVSGLYQYKYRYYSAELGRWPSRDPIND